MELPPRIIIPTGARPRECRDTPPARIISSAAGDPRCCPTPKSRRTAERKPIGLLSRSSRRTGRHFTRLAPGRNPRPCRTRLRAESGRRSGAASAGLSVAFGNKEDQPEESVSPRICDKKICGRGVLAAPRDFSAQLAGRGRRSARRISGRRIRVTATPHGASAFSCTVAAWIASYPASNTLPAGPRPGDDP